MSAGTGGAHVGLRSNERKPATVAPIVKLPDMGDNGALWMNSVLFYPERERIAVYIDGPSIHHAMKKSRGEQEGMPRVDLDYKRLLRLFASLGQLHSISFYAINHDSDQGSIRPLADWMDYNGYRVVLRTPRFFIDEKGKEREKVSLDVEIAVDMLKTAMGSAVDHIVLFSTDGDFCAAVNACRQHNCRVTVVSITHLASDDLRRAASGYLDLNEIMPLIEKSDRGTDAVAGRAA